jgi:hypothetical protein
MKENFQTLLAKMDEKLWLRMLICFMPGIVVSKLAGQMPGPFIGMVGIILLIVGGAVFVMWARLRGLEPADDEEEETVEKPVALAPGLHQIEQRPASEYSKLMTELVAYYGGSGVAAVDAVATEVAVNPKLTYVEAIELAHRRKRLEVVKQ